MHNERNHTAAGLVLRLLYEETPMKKYQCTACDYVYDPEVGDPDNGVDPGTAFEDLPDDWTCPDCGLGKDVFEPLDD